LLYNCYSCNRNVQFILQFAVLLATTEITAGYFVVASHPIT